ncbi:hypothetical protein LguiB_014126 [Lonicera macranthoides]
MVGYQPENNWSVTIRTLVKAYHFKTGSNQEEKMKRQNFNTDDRLSELPDAILAHILSFLDTKYAVQTSSLSKRWINLWISVTTLVSAN